MSPLIFIGYIISIQFITVHPMNIRTIIPMNIIPIIFSLPSQAVSKKTKLKDFPRWIHIKSCIVLKASNGRRKLLQGGVSFFETRELFAGVQPLGSGLLMTAKEAQNTSYPLVNCHITMERSTIFNGKTHYK
jgi:hypothetical protein